MYSTTINIKINKLLTNDKALSKQYRITKFFEQNIDRVKWHDLLSNNVVSEDFYLKHFDKIIWGCLSFNNNLSDEFCQKYIEALDFDVLCLWKSQKFIDYNVNHNNKIINYDNISQNANFDEEYFETNINRMIWFYLCLNTNLSDKFFLRHIDKINIQTLCRNVNVSEDFFDVDTLSNYQWVLISQYIRLSENFINKYHDKICFNMLSKNINITKNIITKYIDKLDINSLVENPATDEDFINKNLHKIYKHRISSNTNVGIDFHQNNIQWIDWFELSRNNFEHWLNNK
jgi:hypothetical protein